MRTIGTFIRNTALTTALLSGTMLAAGAAHAESRQVPRLKALDDSVLDFWARMKVRGVVADARRPAPTPQAHLVQRK